MSPEQAAEMKKKVATYEAKTVELNAAKGHLENMRWGIIVDLKMGIMTVGWNTKQNVPLPEHMVKALTESLSKMISDKIFFLEQEIAKL